MKRWGIWEVIREYSSQCHPTLPTSSSLIPLILKVPPHSPVELHPLHSLPILPLDPSGSLVLSGKAVSWMMALGVSMSYYRQELASQDTGYLSCPDTTPSKSPINSLAWGGWALLCEVGAQTQLVFRFGHNFVPLFGSR